MADGVSPTPELLQPFRLSRELREGTGPDLAKRRIGIGLSLVGAVIAGAVTAYQMGLVERLPDILPGDVWDAEKVDASDYAYRHLQQPDAPMMLVNYGLTAMGIAAGGAHRAAQNPALPIVAAGKPAAGFATCLALARTEWRENRKPSSWRQVATAVFGATMPLALPEAAAAIRGARAGGTPH